MTFIFIPEMHRRTDTHSDSSSVTDGKPPHLIHVQGARNKLEVLFKRFTVFVEIEVELEKILH